MEENSNKGFTVEQQFQFEGLMKVLNWKDINEFHQEFLERYGYYSCVDLVELYNKWGWSDRDPDDPCRIAYADLMSLVLVNMPPELKRGFDEGFQRLFPDLKAIGVNDDGVPVYSVENVADVLGVDLEELEEYCEMSTVHPLH